MYIPLYIVPVYIPLLRRPRCVASERRQGVPASRLCAVPAPCARSSPNLQKTTSRVSDSQQTITSPPGSYTSTGSIRDPESTPPSSCGPSVQGLPRLPVSAGRMLFLTVSTYVRAVESDATAM